MIVLGFGKNTLDFLNFVENFGLLLVVRAIPGELSLESPLFIDELLFRAVFIPFWLVQTIEPALHLVHPFLNLLSFFVDEGEILLQHILDIVLFIQNSSVL
jgi:hypothetical protein